MRVLVIDDDESNRKLLKSMVAKMGECDTASNGKEALSAFKKAWEDWQPYDLVFLDILMPEMDGCQVLNKIRELERKKGFQTNSRLKLSWSAPCHRKKW